MQSRPTICGCASLLIVSDFGEIEYITVGVQVIPVVVVIVVADEFMRRDANDPVHQIFGSPD
jgi:hypothetical protein